jgi:Tol biopolymer transport system component
MKTKVMLPFLFQLLIFAVLLSCGKNEIIKDNAAKPYNFSLTIYDNDIDHPENDRRSYYEVLIDKAEAGRTTIGLESQKKIFEAKLTPDRHLIKVEKWVLDESQGRYIKLNNLYQPKPDFIYINIEEGKISRVNVESSRYGTSRYTIIKE